MSATIRHLRVRTEPTSVTNLLEDVLAAERSDDGGAGAAMVVLVDTEQDEDGQVEHVNVRFGWYGLSEMEKLALLEMAKCDLLSRMQDGD